MFSIFENFCLDFLEEYKSIFQGSLTCKFDNFHSFFLFCLSHLQDARYQQIIEEGDRSMAYDFCDFFFSLFFSILRAFSNISLLKYSDCSLVFASGVTCGHIN